MPCHIILPRWLCAFLLFFRSKFRLSFKSDVYFKFNYTCTLQTIHTRQIRYPNAARNLYVQYIAGFVISTEDIRAIPNKGWFYAQCCFVLRRERLYPLPTGYSDSKSHFDSFTTIRKHKATSVELYDRALEI